MAAIFFFRLLCVSTSLNLFPVFQPHTQGSDGDLVSDPQNSPIALMKWRISEEPGPDHISLLMNIQCQEITYVTISTASLKEQYRFWIKKNAQDLRFFLIVSMNGSVIYNKYIITMDQVKEAVTWANFQSYINGLVPDCINWWLRVRLQYLHC